MKEQNTTVGIFDTRDAAVKAVKELNKGEFPMKKVSIIGKELEKAQNTQSYYTWKETVKTKTGTRAFWSSIFGILVGVGFVIVPGIGKIFVAGSFAAVVISGLEGAVVSSVRGGLFGALLGPGIEKDKVVNYQRNLKAGKYVVVAQGSKGEVDKAREILKVTDPRDVKVLI